MRQHFRYYGLRKGLWWMVADAALWLHRAAVKRTVPSYTPDAPEVWTPEWQAANNAEWAAYDPSVHIRQA